MLLKSRIGKSQYLAVNQQPMFPRDELMEHMRQEMLRRYGGGLSGGGA